MTTARSLDLCSAALLLLVAAPAPAAAATYLVPISALKYTPIPPLQVGDTLVFVNKDLFRHTVTASNNSFDLDLMPGARRGLHINSAGKASFYCKYHPGMRGTMVAK
jgi:plastocyanin